MFKQKKGGCACSGSPAKRDAILLAARQVFLQSGYAAASMDAVAAAANVSKATIYAHFENKRTLFEAVLTHRCQATFGLFDIPERCRDARETLTLLARTFVDVVLAPEAVAIFRVVVAETPRFPEVGESFHRVGPERVEACVQRLLGELTDCGQLAVPPDKVRLATELLCSMMRGGPHLNRMLGLPVSEEEISRHVEGAVELFLARYGTGRRKEE